MYSLRFLSIRKTKRNEEQLVLKNQIWRLARQGFKILKRRETRSKKSDHEKSLLFLLKYFLLFFPLSLPIRSLEAEDFRRVVSWSGHCDGRFPERGWHQERNWRNVFHKESSSFAANWYLLMVKSRISAVWPQYSDTMLPERASHNRSAPSKQQVDTTEEDSSHCRWTMPAWGNTERD